MVFQPLVIDRYAQDYRSRRLAAPVRPVIGVIQPQEISRAGLLKVIAELLGDADMHSFGTAQAWLDTPDFEVFSVVVMELNLRLPECSLSTLELLRRKAPSTRILTLSPLTERQIGLAALRLGASAFLPMTSELDELRAALNALTRGDGYMSTEMAAVLADEAQGKNPRNGFARLSPREMDVIRHLIWGMQLKAVAAKLGLNIRTASCYKRNALNKLGMDSIAEVVRYSSEHGLML